MRHVNRSVIGTRLLATAGLSLLLATPWFTSCASKPAIDIVVQDPDGYRATAKWAQLVVFPDTCPGPETIQAGELTPNVKLFAVAAQDDFPEVGDLDKAKYGFAVILRDESCGVIAYGCTPADLEHHRHVTILLNEHDALDHQAAACSAGEVCDLGSCSGAGQQDGSISDAASEDHASPEGGTTCNLKLVGAANLDNPIDQGAAFAGPVAVATPKGFVIAYREISGDGTTARAVRQFVGDDGTKGARANATVKACASSQASNGVAATWNDSQAAGFMTVSSIACPPDPPEAYIANFDEDGQTITEVSYGLPDAIELTQASAAAPYPGTTQYYLAAVSSDAPVVYTFDGVTVKANIDAIQNGGGAATFAHIASSSNIVATLADSTPADSDAGAPQVALAVRPPGVGSYATSFLSSAAFGTITAWNDRAFAGVPSGASIAWSVVNVDGDAVSDGSLSGGPFNALDSASIGDHVIVVGAAPAKFTVFRMDDISGTMSSGAGFQTTLVSPLGTATLANYDGGRVSIAAARNRVIVTWLNSAAPIPNATTAPGGYAVLTCDN